MIIDVLITEIEKICEQKLPNIELYTKLRNVLIGINNNNFNEELKSCTFKNIIDIKNSDNSYTKYILFSSDKFDLIYIKWNKNSYTKIHDHPDRGCVLKILSGCLIEECYDNNEKYFRFDKINFLSTNMISYKIGKKNLHKIIANQDTESLHIYVPGNYVPKNY